MLCTSQKLGQLAERNSFTILRPGPVVRGGFGIIDSEGGIITSNRLPEPGSLIFCSGVGLIGTAQSHLQFRPHRAIIPPWHEFEETLDECNACRRIFGLIECLQL